MPNPDGTPEGAESPALGAPRANVITEVVNYRERLLTAGGPMASLDRSELFRYKEDFRIFQNELREHMNAGNIPMRVLVLGVGNMEEPLSYVAAASIIAQEAGKSLEELLGMETADIRTRDELHVPRGLGQQAAGGIGAAFLTPEQAKSMTMKPVAPKKEYANAFMLAADGKEYVFRPEIQDYVKRMIEEPSRARFSQPIEDFREEGYDMVSCNNVLQHMGGGDIYRSPFKDPGRNEDDYRRYYEQLEKILQKVRLGALIFIHTDTLQSRGGGSEKHLLKTSFFVQHFEQVRSGVHRRVR